MFLLAPLLSIVNLASQGRVRVLPDEEIFSYIASSDARCELLQKAYRSKKDLKSFKEVINKSGFIVLVSPAKRNVILDNKIDRFVRLEGQGLLIKGIMDGTFKIGEPIDIRPDKASESVLLGEFVKNVLHSSTRPAAPVGQIAIVGEVSATLPTPDGRRNLNIFCSSVTDYADKLKTDPIRFEGEAKKEPLWSRYEFIEGNHIIVGVLPLYKYSNFFQINKEAMEVADAEEKRRSLEGKLTIDQFRKLISSFGTFPAGKRLEDNIKDHLKASLIGFENFGFTSQDQMREALLGDSSDAVFYLKLSVTFVVEGMPADTSFAGAILQIPIKLGKEKP